MNESLRAVANDGGGSEWPVRRFGTASVRILDLHVVRALVAPSEGQAPLLVDPDVPGVVVLLQVVAGRHSHEAQRWRRIQQRELADGHVPDVGDIEVMAGSVALTVILS